MSNEDDFREDLITLLVNGMRIDWMKFSDILEIIDFASDLKEHYMKDEKLNHLFFWNDDHIILHEEKGIESTFAVVVDGQSVQFRTSDGTIDNHKNAGRILMSTVAFVHTKLEELGLVNSVETTNQKIVEKYSNKKQEEDTEEEDSSSDSESESDFEWL